MKIAILDDYQDAVRGLRAFEKLAGHEVTVFRAALTPAEALGDIEALVLIRERTRVDEALLTRMPKLRVISQTGRLSGNVDLSACTRRKVAVTEGGGSPYAPAELTWALVLASRRRVVDEAIALREGRWQTGLGQGLRGQTLGILGYGKIGRLVAEFGRVFGMKVLAWGREGSLQRAREDGVQTASDRAELFSSSDVLSIHLRLTDETRGIVSPEDLARMKPDALLVNTSRAQLIAPGVLERALRGGRPGFAAVDVYEEEPVLGAAHPLLGLPNALCTPHLGYVERDSYELYFGSAFDNLLAFAAGRPQNVANPESLS